MKERIKNSSGKTRLSMLVMGAGQLAYGRIGKGLLFLLAEISILYYFISRGFGDIKGFFTLGEQKGDAWLGIQGDNSVVMLLMGIFAWIVVAALICLYRWNVKDACHMQELQQQGKPLPTFRQELSNLVDKKFYVTVLVLPVIGVCVFNILPIIFMILIAFTNYGGNIVPPELVDWVGLQNFSKLLTLSQFAPTFFKILVGTFCGQCCPLR